jgi:beta-glucosidase
MDKSVHHQTRTAEQERFARQANEIVAQMRLAEKVALMSGDRSLPLLSIDALFYRHYNRVPYTAGGNTRLGVPPLKFCDGPRGVVTGHATCFPVAMQRGASFDVDLERRVGEAIGKEIRALGGNFFGGVCINLLRHPAGGRGQETYGEDSFHVGHMGAALVQGVQTHNVIACVKHFALNNQENARFKINVTCDERTLREVYLPHFKACIDAGAGSVMSAYNKFRGKHLGHNTYLLRTVLKDEWAFDGFVISDFVRGIRDTVKAATAGLDVEMCNTRVYGQRLVKAVERGDVPEAVIDDAAQRIVRTLLRFTQAADPQSHYPKTLVACEEHIALAREVAEKSIVLLKNEASTLPFDRHAVKTVALIGSLGTTANIGDHGSSQVHPPFVVTALAGLKKVLGLSVKVRYHNGNKLDEAKGVAAAADAVVCVVGYTHRDEGEYMGFGLSGDRDQLGLHATDVDLLKAVAPANQHTVVVLIGSSAILMEEWKASVPAIVHAFYPGMEGGTAIARVLFGEVNPGGKLPFSIPTDIRHLPAFDKNAEHVAYDRYHGYTRLEKEGNVPAFAFGYGLSYTTWSCANVGFAVQGNQIEAAVDVTNTGERSGDQVLQLYVGFENSAVDRPKKLLCGFERVTLQPGETKRVVLTCPLERLRWYNESSSSWELEAMEYQAFIGCSSREEDLLQGSFSLPS